MPTLKDVKPGHTIRILKIGGEGPIKRRIMEMGLIRGTAVTVRKIAPLGDPMELTVRGYELSLRKADAELIEVEES
ncbi:MAG: ferrous iron transport protein A [Oscillospiraceae bacterium]|jgi:ferrous iron transport protein A|nr:ferrous iron transport protein A [Oscillospiraceae bacterium]